MEHHGISPDHADSPDVDPALLDGQWVAMARSLLKDGHTGALIIEAMVAQGCDRRRAEQIATAVVSPRRAGQFFQERQKEQRDRRRQAFTRHEAQKRVGAIIFFAGVCITALSMWSSSGQSYIVSWGAMIFGGLMYLRGLFGSRHDG